MSKQISKLLWLYMCLFCVVSVYAQQRTCGVWHPANEPRNAPAYHRQHQQKVQEYEHQKKYLARQSNTCTTPIQLPIAIHFQGLNTPDTACLRALAEGQVVILNNDFNGQNADTTQWNEDAPAFPGVTVGQTCVEFVLANKNHPTGYGLENGEIAVTINTTNGDMLPDWAGYINVVVRDLGMDLGFAPLGGLGTGDAVNVNLTSFGTFGCGEVLPQFPFHLGRTLVHELGHYLYLNHIWANSQESTGCFADDGITDTPVASEPHFGCPSITTSCSSKDLHMNYMDYVNDACMYMFTAGQAQVMNNWVTTNLSHVANNIATVYETPCVSCVPPNCTDNDQDGYCVENDCNDNNNQVPAASGTACDDGNPNTYNDIIQMDGCTCSGILNTCLTVGGDADADGICDDFDCQPHDACFPKPSGTPCDDGFSQTTNDIIQTDGCTCLGETSIQGRLFLEGLMTSSSFTMHTDLKDKNLLPLQPPYQQSPWNYIGGEQAASIPSNAVDWILLMARDEQNQVISTAVGFVNNQGFLIDVNGNLGINLLGGFNNYISFHHRNHIAVVTANPYSNSIDLTQSDAVVKGNQQLKEVNGRYCLFAGDFDGSGIINNVDYNQWILSKSALNQYLTIDGDGNGIVNNLDYNLWTTNGSKIGYEGIQY